VLTATISAALIESGARFWHRTDLPWIERLALLYRVARIRLIWLRLAARFVPAVG
jgi:hypothetical protein